MQRENWIPVPSRLGANISSDNPRYYGTYQASQTLRHEDYSNIRRPSYPGQEPAEFRNPSPPNFSGDHDFPRRSSNATSPLTRETFVSSYTIPTTTRGDGSPENVEQPLDPLLCLIQVNNRFSNMVLSKESITQEEGSIGFSKFHEINQIRALHCWQKQIASSDRTNVVKVRDIIEDSVPAVVRSPVKTEEDEFTDTYAQFRCKRFLRGKACEGHCRKIHRLPKEDGVKCISQKHGQCHQGSNCNFVHEDPSDDSDSDNNDDPPPTSMAVGHVLEKLKRSNHAKNVNCTKDATSTVLVKEECSTITARAIKPSDPCANNSNKDDKMIDTPIRVTSNISRQISPSDPKENASVGLIPVHKIKQEPADFVKSKSTLECANSSSSSYSSTTTMTTSTTLSQSNDPITVMKRKAQSPADQRAPKKEKIDNPIAKIENAPTNVSVGHVNVKSEPEDLELFKEETVESMVLTGSHVKSEIVNGNDHITHTTPFPEAPCSGTSVPFKVSVPHGYVLASPERLNAVSVHICAIISDLECKKTELDLDPTADLYGKICEYLHRKKVTVLSEVSNPKILVWDIHIRLFFTSLLQLDTEEYLANIQSHLANEPFDDFFTKVFDIIAPST